MSIRYSSNFARRFSLEQIEPAIAESTGFCIACGEKKVYGAEQLVIMGLVS